jgi:hypothetical protein
VLPSFFLATSSVALTEPDVQTRSKAYSWRCRRQGAAHPAEVLRRWAWFRIGLRPSGLISRPHPKSTGPGLGGMVRIEVQRSEELSVGRYSQIANRGRLLENVPMIFPVTGSMIEILLNPPTLGQIDQNRKYLTSTPLPEFGAHLFRQSVDGAHFGLGKQGKIRHLQRHLTGEQQRRDRIS